MGIKDINQQKQNTFKSVELERKTKKAHDIETFIENAEGETSKKRYGAPLKDKEKKSTERYGFYCTPAESKKLRAMAEQYDMKIAEFIKFKVFDKYKNM